MLSINESFQKYMNSLVINEAYIGKTETLREIEKQFDILKKNGELKFYSSISQSPTVLKINRLFEKQFGMDCFGLQVMNTEQHNAFTWVVATTFDVARRIDLSDMVTGTMSEGFKFKPNNGLCIVVNISFGLLKDLTAAEIVGVILHEIGHNFADALYDKIKFHNKNLMKAYERELLSYTTLVGFIFALPLYLAAKKQLKIMTNSYRKQEQEKQQSKKQSKVKGFLAGLSGKHKDLSSFLSAVAGRILRTTKYSVLNYKRYAGEKAKKDARESLDRQNEVFADKFAGVYGYSVEISTALTKMTYNRTKVDKFMDKYEALRKANQEYHDAIRDINDYDCHPQLIQRINEEIKLLSNEIAKEDVDPKVKKILQDQLDELNKLLKKITDTSKKLSQEEQAQNIYNDYVNQNMPDAVSDKIEKAIEDALDKLLEEDKKKKIS